jgi:hypothetical protein
VFLLTLLPLKIDGYVSLKSIKQKNCFEKLFFGCHLEGQ